MAEYSRIAKGRFTSTGNAQVVNLPFQPDRIEMTNFTATATPANHGIPFAWWDVLMGQGTGLGLVNNATPVLTSGQFLTNGFSTFSAGLLLQYGPTYQFSNSGNPTFSISQSSTAPLVTTSVAHGLATGNVVIFENLYQTATTGMVQICGIPFTVTVTGATTFTINWNTNQSTYAAFDSSTATNNAGSWKQVLYPYLYAPDQAVISAINTSTNVITTTSAHNFVVGQEVAFRIPTIWGSTQLNSLPNVVIPGSPGYYYVTAVTQNTFTVSGNLTAVTAYNSNFNGGAVIPTGAWTFPQVVPVGDVNTGGVQFSGGALYPSPLVYNGSGTAQVSTINGPAIQGAFVNNTSQGFIIGSGNIKVGAAGADTSSHLVGAASDVIYWVAYYSDLAVV
jgi:hypothetical protein